MCTCGLPDIYTLGPRGSGVYIRQTTRAHGITIKYTPVLAPEFCQAYQIVLPIRLCGTSSSSVTMRAWESSVDGSGDGSCSNR